MMKVDLRETGDVVVVDLEGSLVTGGGAELLGRVVDEVLGSGWRKVVLNLSGVRRIDSSCVGELVAAHRLAREVGSSLRIVEAREAVYRVLRLGHLLPVLEVHESEEEALSSLDGAAEAEASRD